MKNLNLTKRIISLILSGVTLVTPCFSVKKIDDQTQSTGLFDLTSRLGKYTIDSDFVIFKVGNPNVISTNNISEKIKICNEAKIPAGIIISGNLLNECDLYNCIDYAKAYIYNFKINFPVYFDVNKLLSSEKLTYENKINNIKRIINACRQQKIYFALYGNDSELCKLPNDVKKTCDALVVKDSEDINYDGNYSAYIENENLYSLTDISEIIEEQGFNKSENLKSNLEVEITNDRTFEDVAKEYNLNLDDLLRYNKNNKEIGFLCKIPSEVCEIINLNNNTYKILEKPLRGIDISSKKNDISLNNLQGNIDFALINCLKDMETDKEFSNNIAFCKDNHLNISIYCTNGITKELAGNNLNKFKELQIQQAEKVIEILKSKDIKYPIYLKFDNIDFSKDYYECMLNVWKEYMQKNGYIYGISTSKSEIEKIKNMDIDLNDYQIWSGDFISYNYDSLIDNSKNDMFNLVPIYFSNVDYSEPFSIEVITNHYNFEEKTLSGFVEKTGQVFLPTLCGISLLGGTFLIKRKKLTK